MTPALVQEVQRVAFCAGWATAAIEDRKRGAPGMTPILAGLTGGAAAGLVLMAIHF
jgi:hypothetical protein